MQIKTESNGNAKLIELVLFAQIMHLQGFGFIIDRYEYSFDFVLAVFRMDSEPVAETAAAIAYTHIFHLLFSITRLCLRILASIRPVINTHFVYLIKIEENKKEKTNAKRTRAQAFVHRASESNTRAQFF